MSKVTLSSQDVLTLYRMAMASLVPAMENEMFLHGKLSAVSEAKHKFLMKILNVFAFDGEEEHSDWQINDEASPRGGSTEKLEALSDFAQAYFREKMTAQGR